MEFRFTIYCLLVTRLSSFNTDLDIRIKFSDELFFHLDIAILRISYRYKSQVRTQNYIVQSSHITFIQFPLIFNILHNHGILIKTKKLAQYNTIDYKLYSSFSSFSTNVFFLFQDLF